MLHARRDATREARRGERKIARASRFAVRVTGVASTRFAPIFMAPLARWSAHA